jgi:hypothetical protein
MARSCALSGKARACRASARVQTRDQDQGGAVWPLMVADGLVEVHAEPMTVRNRIQQGEERGYNLSVICVVLIGHVARISPQSILARGG